MLHDYGHRGPESLKTLYLLFNIYIYIYIYTNTYIGRCEELMAAENSRYAKHSV